MPLALAILLSCALGPLATWLYRRVLPCVPAVLSVMVLVTLLLAGFARLVASQLTHLAQQLPTYESDLRLKMHELAAAAPGSGVLNRTADFMRDFCGENGRITAGPEATGGEGGTAVRRAGGPTTSPFDPLFLSYLDATARWHARRLLLRLRACLGRGIPSCVWLWGSSPDEMKQRLATTHAEAVTAGLGEAVTKTLELLAQQDLSAEAP
ncbi:MAG: AI-2E family transporter [Geminicoccaceae bacterium]